MEYKQQSIDNQIISWVKVHLRTPLFLNSYLLIAMRASGTLFGFLFWALAARFMVDTDVGLASGVVSATMLLSGLAQLGLGYSLTRHLPQAKDPNRMLNLTIILSGLVGFVLALLFLVLLPWLSPALLPLHSSVIHMASFVVLVTCWSLSMLLHWIFVATRRVVFSFTRQAGHMAIAVALLFLFHFVAPGFTAALFAHVIAVIFSVVFSFHALPKAQPGYRFSLPLSNILKGQIRTPFAKYAFINYVGDQFHRIPDTILPLLIINTFGPSKGAYFFIVWTIGSALSTWISSMSQSLFAEGSHHPEMASILTQRAAKLGLLLCGGVTLAVVVFGRWILLIYGESYVEQGLILLYIVTMASTPRVLLSLFSSLLLVREQLAAVFALKIIASVAGLLLIYVGITYLDFVGAGIGWLVSQTLVLIGIFVWWRWQGRRDHNSQASAISNQAGVQS